MQATLLKKILATKQQEVAASYQYCQANPESVLAKAIDNPQRAYHSAEKMTQALSKPGLSVIAEIKRRSPSMGQLAEISDPAALAMRYQQGGAAAISVLTCPTYFGGALSDLTTVVEAVADSATAVLRKEFVIDQIQIIEAALACADAVLLIVAATGEQTKVLCQTCLDCGLVPIVEVHDQAECAFAVEMNAPVIGINHRNLHDFSLNTALSETLIKQIPTGILTVAESGINSQAQVSHLAQLGFDGILVGQALVLSEHPEQSLLQWLNQASSQ